MEKQTHLPRMEFHVASSARETYDLEDSLFNLTGNLVFINYSATRQLAQKLNEKRNLVEHPDQTVYASDLNALGLIDEISHVILKLYKDQVDADIFKKAGDFLKDELGSKNLETVLQTFIKKFPPQAVFNGDISPEEFLDEKSGGVSNHTLTLEELLVHWLANVNPAFSPFAELFEDTPLRNTTKYEAMIDGLTDFFEEQPPIGPDRESLLSMLRRPALEHPDSLQDQLKFIRDRWDSLIGDYLIQLLKSLDFLEEEHAPRGIGPGPAQIPIYESQAENIEAYSPDSEWMPRVVMIAKNALVWLDQLSRQYQQTINRLDQIPDAELDRLADYGFTALWLIGIWERSRISQQIKHWMGNPDAEASAYSLRDYVIAEELGGDPAFQQLKERCGQRGIRLASDMVPNHTGLDSTWMREHPDGFIQVDQPPYPSYTFNSGDLSDDPNFTIQLEDHYYERSDAAVVFKHIDHNSGKVRYIYHGNDGTSMPWNDTAQLNYLLPEVRETVIQTILHVARQTPIIRFDAAMTLAKKHIQRLWFPAPGTGSGVPSRAEHGLSNEEFQRQMPREFWREVVDRVAQEAPHTLLLAEAFWMMEGFFVRTLGMHRVYNSAFMNMLKLEDNDQYRQTIKNTLVYDPQILKRFVNFLNNPDEESASAQFGDGDKYFAVTAMMVTMPGLPMFGHGQIEGYHEKYGMEFRRAYWDETPDQHLIERHQHLIFPLMKKRYLFAEAEHFRLYDFTLTAGSINENVFAYSNGMGDERVLVCINNSYDRTSGHLKISVPFLDKSLSGNGDSNPQVRQETLVEALGIPDDPNQYLVLREHSSGLEFIRNCQDLHRSGFYVALEGYQAQMFWEFRIWTESADGHLETLTRELDERGVDSIDVALKNIILKPIHRSLEKVLSYLWDIIDDPSAGDDILHRSNFKKCLQKAISNINKMITGKTGNPDSSLIHSILKDINTFSILATLRDHFPGKNKRYYAQAAEWLRSIWKRSPELILLLMLVRIIRKASNQDTDDFSSNGDWINRVELTEPLTKILALHDQDILPYFGYQNLLRFLLNSNVLYIEETGSSPLQLFRSFLQEEEFRIAIGWNHYEDKIWFHQESMSAIITLLYLQQIIDPMIITIDDQQIPEKIVAVHRSILPWLEALDQCDFSIQSFDRLLSGEKEQQQK